MAYTDLATVKLAIGDVTAAKDTLINQSIAAAEKWIDDKCGRTFTKDTDPTVRVFRTAGNVACGPDGEALLVDDIADTAGLIVETGDGTTWTVAPASSYDTEPDNAIARKKPVVRLRMVDGTWSHARRVRVTARFGWPEVPGTVKEAAKIQAIRLYKRKDSPEGEAGPGEWGTTTFLNSDPDVRAMLNPYVKAGFG